MGGLLEAIKRRLRTSSRVEGRQGPPSAVPPPQPPPPSTSPAAGLTLASPRRIALGPAWAEELAALQHRFAALPQHQSPSREALRTRLAQAAAGHPAAEDAGPAPTPRRGTKRPPVARAARKQPAASHTERPAWQPVAATAAAADTGADADTEEASEEPAALPERAAPDPAAAQRSKLARLKQARWSAEGAPGRSPRVTGGLPEAEASSASLTLPLGEVREPSGRWTLGQSSATQAEPAGALLSVQPGLAVRLTPRVLAAAAERAQPRSRPASEAAAGSPAQRSTAVSSAASSRRTTTATSHASTDLGLTLAPWAGAAGTPPLPANSHRTSSASEHLPELPSRSQWRASSQQQPTTSTGASAADASTVLPLLARGTSPLLQRLSRADLPADLLSLRESASLARQKGQAGRPPLATRRRALSAHTPAENEAGGDAPVLAGLDQSASPAAPGLADGAAALAREAGASSTAQRLAALRRQRRPGWHSDFPAAVPGWPFSQVGSFACLQVWPVLGAPSVYLVTSFLSASAQDGEATAVLPPLPGPAIGSDQPALAAAPAAEPAAEPPAAEVQRPRGLTRAQLRQQAAWGSQAGSLEAMLKRPLAQPPQRVDVHDAAPADQGAVSGCHASWWADAPGSWQAPLTWSPNHCPPQRTRQISTAPAAAQQLHPWASGHPSVLTSSHHQAAASRSLLGRGGGGRCRRRPLSNPWKGWLPCTAAPASSRRAASSGTCHRACAPRTRRHVPHWLGRQVKEALRQESCRRCANAALAARWPMLGAGAPGGSRRRCSSRLCRRRRRCNSSSHWSGLCPCRRHRCSSSSSSHWRRRSSSSHRQRSSHCHRRNKHLKRAMVSQWWQPPCTHRLQGSTGSSRHQQRRPPDLPPLGQQRTRRSLQSLASGRFRSRSRLPCSQRQL